MISCTKYRSSNKVVGMQTSSRIPHEYSISGRFLLDVDLFITNQIDSLQAFKTSGLAAHKAAIDGVHIYGLAIQVADWALSSTM